ncbi:hypothetical protein SMD20_17900 [Nonomuraea sp. LP-02]|uniref:hypothetical protein n=1 Tax=Nonomuraea sp. LP-02 TaxID=3097960 RepID=UPI002E311612|nr:hypothetical protein [Nonomuraea sp. LP-02]MED7926135.1 hypothetical protein [Nonomuraea sp. LP-02]
MTVPPAPSVPPPPKKDHRVQIVVAVIGACAAILAAIIPVVVSRFDDPEPTPSPTDSAVVTSVTPSDEDPPPVDDTPSVDDTPAVDDPPETTPPGPDPALAVPEDYRGSWSGQVDWRPPLQGSYSTTLTISAGSLGGMVGQFSAQGDTCRGALWLEAGGGPIVLRLKTTYDGGGCSSLADVKLTLDDDGDLRYELIAAQFPQGFVNQPAPPATGTLTRD